MALDTSWFRSPFALQLREEGREAESIKKLLRLLVKRGIAVTEPQRARIEGCTDLDQLDEWFDRAATATSAAEVFDAD